MSIKKFILNATGEPVPEPDLMTWGKWMETAQRSVADERIGETRISTVFLGLDHNYTPGDPPILWETMIFGGPLNHDMDRCAGSREQAEAMHARMLEKMRSTVGITKT